MKKKSVLLVGGVMSMTSFIAETNGIRVCVSNASLLKVGDKVETRLGDTLTVIGISKDTVLFSGFCVAGSLKKL